MLCHLFSLWDSTYLVLHSASHTAIQEGIREVAIFIKCKNIFTKMLKDVGIEVPKSIETRSKCSMHAGKGRG